MGSQELKNIFSGYLNWGKERWGILDSSTIERSKKRLEICIACPDFNKADDKCNLCGCPKGSIKAKILSTGNTCPAKPSKWKE